MVRIAILLIGPAAALLVHTWFEGRERLQTRRLLGIEVRREPRLKRFKAKNNQALPEFLEMLALSLSSGRSLEDGWREAARSIPSSMLSHALVRVSDEIGLGKSREEAIQNFMKELDDPSVSFIFILILSSLKRGAPLHDALLTEAENLRTEQFRALEERAQTAGIRLLFPMVFFILPVLFLILLGPIAIQYSQGKLF